MHRAQVFYSLLHLHKSIDCNKDELRRENKGRKVEERAKVQGEGGKLGERRKEEDRKRRDEGNRELNE